MLNSPEQPEQPEHSDQVAVDSSQHEEPSETPTSEEPEFHDLSTEEMIGMAREAIEAFAEKAKPHAEAGLARAREAADSTLKNVRRAGGAVLDAATPDGSEMHTSGEKALDLAIELLPIVGRSKEYLTARAMYIQGRKEGDHEMVEKAKVQCLIACAGVPVDVLTLGTGRTVISAITLAVKIQGAKALSQIVGQVPGFNGVDVVTSTATKLLKNSMVDKAMEDMLKVSTVNLPEMPEAAPPESALKRRANRFLKKVKESWDKNG